MGLMKFITVFDDEKQTLFYEEILKRYDISAWPTVYTSQSECYLDGINTDSVRFIEHKRNTEILSGPFIPTDVFQQAIKFAYEDGFAVAVIVCPNRKWYPYYSEAIKAANRVKRSTKMNFNTFRVCVIDTKSFASGALYHALIMSRLHNNDHCPTGIVIEDSKNIKSKSIILTKSGSEFGFRRGELSAFRVFGNRLYSDVNISDSTEYLQFENFTNACCKYIRNSQGKYLVSVGAKCNFSGNIIGRIERNLGYPPVATVQYGAASADILGVESICIHIL